MLLQGHHLTILFFPSPSTLPTPGGGRIWAWPLSIPPSNQRFISRTSPTPLSTAPLLCNGSGGPHVPPPSFQVNPRNEPLPEPPHGVTGNLPAAPNRVHPSQPPLTFVDGNGYIVLRGVAEARDCEVGWGKVMSAWGSGDEKVGGGEILSCCSTPGGVKSRQGILNSPGVGKAKARRGRGWGGGPF